MVPVAGVKAFLGQYKLLRIIKIECIVFTGVEHIDVNADINIVIADCIHNSPNNVVNSNLIDHSGTDSSKAITMTR